MSDAARSVVRIAALLELFERERRPLSSTEIGESLDVPRSSTGTLLKALVQLGWLTIDRRRATYFPGARLARLTGWLLSESLLDDRVLRALEAMCASTGETVTISCANDLEVEILHVRGPTSGIHLVVEEGQRIPLWGSAIGTAYLTTLADTTIRSMYRRNQHDARGRRTSVSLAEVLKTVRRARRDGYAFVDSFVVPGVAAISAPLPDEIGPRPLIASVGGPADRLRTRTDAIVAALQRFIGAVR
ncbi:MAG: IclR family transcriptional regulator [Burkholderiales bacterium]|nr:IclR family transcriptional regulator [Burkholderiales bacterium]